ncbi:type II toxin-antitoxin system RelB family antitoxin [Streptococcus troglodytae]|uniref:CopG family transcriptional regulator n=1 Tax=Streptococcus troglodytae TaxID=1111760 RepID=A0A1L7LJ57_9STRE|nr:DUF6290 family protein [Streptococcus troglodytae]BAQ24062.1 uncharacterized protein SRT_08010 [Streptococcus troglodytae]
MASKRIFCERCSDDVPFHIVDDLSEYVQTHGLTISESARQAMLERIEDDYDLQVLRQAMAEDDGTRISHREVFKEFGIKV